MDDDSASGTESYSCYPTPNGDTKSHPNSTNHRRSTREMLLPETSTLEEKQVLASNRPTFSSSAVHNCLAQTPFE